MELIESLQAEQENFLSKTKKNPNIGYKPINLSTLANLSKDFQLQKIQQQLEDVYDRKNEILFQIQSFLLCEQRRLKHEHRNRG